MASRDYDGSPVSDILGMRSIIDGLASDLQSMRAKEISPQEGLARAAIAKQIFNGVRLYMQAVATIDGRASDGLTVATIEAKP